MAVVWGKLSGRWAVFRRPSRESWWGCWWLARGSAFLGGQGGDTYGKVSGAPTFARLGCGSGRQEASGMTRRHLGWVLTTETEIQERGRDWEQKVWVSGLGTLSRSACGISWGACIYGVCAQNRSVAGGVVSSF